MKVVIVNPLAAALAHYETQLSVVLRECGIDVESLELLEPGHSGASRLSWVLGTWRLLISARRIAGRQGRVLLVWPPLGYLDALFAWVVLGPRVRVMIHDPEPLVFARGYGKASRFVAKRLTRAKLLVHSDTAREVIRRQGLDRRAVRLLLPILPPTLAADPKTSRRPRVVVFGQFKPDRNLVMLASVGEELGHEFDLEIHGTKWPEVRGWDVHRRFVDEDEVPALLGNADVVVIPYTRFFQSAVALRALECGTPVVGPLDSSLREIFGTDSGLLVTGDDEAGWSSAVRLAAALSPGALATFYADYHERCLAEWRNWLSN